MNSTVLAITTKSLESFLVLIQNYGIAMIISVFALYFIYKFIIKNWKRFNKSEDLKESLLEKTINGENNINAKINKYEEKILSLKKELTILKNKNLNSLKYHEVFFTIKHHLKMVYMIDFKDEERNNAFRNILINKLTTINKYAEYLLTLNKIHNVDNIDSLPRIVISTEIYDVIDNIITEYNNQCLQDFIKMFSYNKRGIIISSDCLTKECFKKINRETCNYNLGECIFNKIMNDPDKGFNTWHKPTIDNIIFNLDYYTADDTITNTEVIRLTLGELSKGGSMAIEHIHNSFEHFNGDLTHLFDIYREEKYK
jgi:hypothetical protein